MNNNEFDNWWNEETEKKLDEKIDNNTKSEKNNYIDLQSSIAIDNKKTIEVNNSKKFYEDENYKIQKMKEKDFDNMISSLLNCLKILAVAFIVYIIIPFTGYIGDSKEYGFAALFDVWTWVGIILFFFLYCVFFILLFVALVFLIRSILLLLKLGLAKIVKKINGNDLYIKYYEIHKKINGDVFKRVVVIIIITVYVSLILIHIFIK